MKTSRSNVKIVRIAPDMALTGLGLGYIKGPNLIDGQVNAKR